MLTNRNTRFFRLAKKQSEKSTHKKIQMGAVIVLGNYVVSKGWNQNKTHPTQFKYNRFRNVLCHHKLHAEIHALMSTREDLSGAEIYIYREDKAGLLAPSRPCCACYNAIKDSGISKMYYTSRSGFKSEEV